MVFYFKLSKIRRHLPRGTSVLNSLKAFYNMLQPDLTDIAYIRLKERERNMENANLLNNDDQFVASEQTCRQYSIVFDGCSIDGNSNSCVIPVKSRREVELLLLILGEEAGIIMDNQARLQHPDVWDWLSGCTYSEVLADLKWSYREEDEVINIIEKIPLPASLNKSFIKLSNDDPDPEPIDQEYAHKTHPENVLISKPYQCGNMYYFNGFTKSPEFNIDHYSDHLEGIIMFEVARQAGNSSAHLVGMPFTGANIILKTFTRHTKFLESSEPYLIRTIPAYKQKGGAGYCVYNIIQNGKSCVAGYFSVLAYNSKDIYARFRHSKLIDRVSSEKVVDLQQSS